MGCSVEDRREKAVKVMSNKKQLQILLVAFIFSAILMFVALPPILNLALIDQDRVVGEAGNIEFTTGDTLTIFALFGSTVTVVVWLSSYRKGR